MRPRADTRRGAGVEMAGIAGAQPAQRCYDPALKDKRRRMEYAGKPFKVVIIAIARLLLTQLNAIIRNDRNYVPGKTCEQQLLRGYQTLEKGLA